MIDRAAQFNLKAIVDGEDLDRSVDGVIERPGPVSVDVVLAGVAEDGDFVVIGMSGSFFADFQAFEVGGDFSGFGVGENGGINRVAGQQVDEKVANPGQEMRIDRARAFVEQVVDALGHRVEGTSGILGADGGQKAGVGLEDLLEDDSIQKISAFVGVTGGQAVNFPGIKVGVLSDLIFDVRIESFDIGDGTAKNTGEHVYGDFGQFGGLFFFGGQIAVEIQEDF